MERTSNGWRGPVTDGERKSGRKRRIREKVREEGRKKGGKE